MIKKIVDDIVRQVCEGWTKITSKDPDNYDPIYIKVDNDGCILVTDDAFGRPNVMTNLVTMDRGQLDQLLGAVHRPRWRRGDVSD